jgi:hypothetical protein
MLSKGCEMRQKQDLPSSEPPKVLTPQAERALQEAEERRRRRTREAPVAAKEIGGRQGPEPTRYGDWEKDGLASDF